MNKIYSKVWNKELGQLVVASEFARSDSTGVVQGAGAATLLRRSLLAAVIAPMLALAGLSSAALAQDSSWTVTDGSESAEITDGGTVTFQGGNNISVAQTGIDDAGTVVISLDEDIDLGEDGRLTIGNTLVSNTGVAVGGNVVLDTTGLTAGGVSVTTAGINAGNTIITKVSAGTASDHAVNLGQLDVVRTDASDAAQAATDAAAAAAAAQSTANEAVASAGAGWTVTDGASDANIGPGGTVTFTGDDNITVAQTGGAGAGEVEFTLNRDLAVDSLAIEDGPSLTATGIDAGETRITNLADGAITATSTDAVSGRQVHKLFFEEGTAFGVRYFRANSTASDSLAEGEESIAIGPNTVAEGDSSFAAGDGATTTASAEGAIAVGQGATAGGELTGGIAAIAIGRDSEATGNSAMALGDGASAGGANATALGAGAAAGGAGGVALGEDAVAAAQNNISIGSAAGQNTGQVLPSDQSHNIAVGSAAGQNVAGQFNVAMGDAAGSGVEGDDNVAFGRGAGAGIDGDDNVSIGRDANVGANSNRAVAVGYGSGAETEGIAIGFNATAGNTGVAVGRQATAVGTGTAVGPNAYADSNYVALGMNSRSVQSDVSGNSFLTNRPFEGGAVSVGSSAPGMAGFTRRIVNVEDGANPTDAVNVRQLEMAIGNIDLGDIDFADGIINNLQEQIDRNMLNYVSINDGGVDQGNKDNNGADAAAIDSIAIGPDATTKNRNSIAIGHMAGAEGDSAVVLGHNIKGLGLNSTTVGNSQSEARDESGIAIGTNVVSRDENSIVIGRDSYTNRQANGPSVQNSIVIGTSSSSTAVEGIVIGRDAIVNAPRGIAQGSVALTTASDAMAFGTRSHASGVNAQASGTDASASGADSIATGTGATSFANDGVAIGTGAESGFHDPSNIKPRRNMGGVAIGDSALADNYHALAVGVDAEATAESATAIGDGAEASADDALAVGTGATAAEVSASAFGQGANAQSLNSLAVGSDASAFGDNASAVGTGATAMGVNALAVGAGAQASAQNASAFGQGAQATNPNSVALGAGSVTDNPFPTSSGTINDITYGGFAGDNPGSVVSVGAQDAERQISNVAAGRISPTSTDAINGSQLFATQTVIGNVAHSTADILGGNADVGSDGTITMTAVGGTEYDTVHEAIEYAAQGWNVSAQSGAAANVAPGGAVDFGSSDGNIDISLAGTDLDFALSDEIEVGTSITVGDTVIDGDSVTTNNLTVEGDTSLGDNFTVNSGGVYYDGPVTDGNHVANKTYVDGEIDTLANTPLTFAGDEGSFERVLGQAVNVTGGAATPADLTDGNIGVVAVGADTLEIKLNKDIDLGVDGSVAIGDTTVDGTGVQVGDDVHLGDAGLVITDGPSVTAEGIDAGDMVVANVAAGEVSSTSTDAINGSQLFGVSNSVATAVGGNTVVNPDGTITTSDIGDTGHDNIHDAIGAVNTAANAGWNLTGSGADEVNIGPNGSVDFQGDANIDVAQSGEDQDGVIEVTLSRNLDVDSVTAGDSVLDDAGLVVDDGAGNVTTVGAGSVAVADGAGTTVIGGNEISVGGANEIAISGDTGTIGGLTNQTIDHPDFADGSGRAATEDQLALVNETANMGWHVSVDNEGAGDDNNVGPAGVVDFTSADGNIQITREETDLEFSLADAIEVADSVEVAGNTTIDGTGVGVGDDVHLGDTGLVIGDADGPRFTNDGISAGNQVVNGVADGVADTDAVNVRQLEDTRTKYYSVNDNGVVQGNYDNDGATGVNALAAGVNTQAEGANSVAIGSGAVASSNFGSELLNPIGANTNPSTPGDFAVAIGHEARALGNQTIAVGRLAGTGAMGSNNVLLGARAGENSETSNNIFLGERAGSGLAADPDGNEGAPFLRGHNVGLGMDTLQDGHGENNTAVGLRAGRWQEGSSNTHVGSFAGVAQQGDFNVNAGYFAGQYTDSRGSVNIGVEAGAGIPDGRVAADYAVSIGYQAKALDDRGVAIGDRAYAGGLSQIAIGGEAGLNSLAVNSTAIGLRAGQSVTGVDNVALGRDAGSSVATGANVAIGTGAGNDVTARSNPAVGAFPNVTGQNVAIGGQAGDAVQGDLNVGIGWRAGRGTTGVANVGLGPLAGLGTTGDQNVAVGATAGQDVQGRANIAMGNFAGVGVEAANTISLGSGALGSSNYAIAIGTVTMAEGLNAIAVGRSTVADSEDGVAIGRNAQATHAGSVALGAESVTAEANPTPNGTVGGITYGEYAGNTPESVVSVGAEGAERQVTNVAAGRVSASSTDAINGSQLFATQAVIGNVANSVVTVLGGNAAVDVDGNITTSDIGNTGHHNVHDAIDNVNTTANMGWNISAEGGNATNVGPGGSVDLNNGDGNIVITKADDSNDVTFDLADNIELSEDGSVAIGDGTEGSTLDAGGLEVVDGGNSTAVGAGTIAVTDAAGTTTIGGNVVSVGGGNPIVISGDTGTIGGLTNTTFDPDGFTSGQAATEDQLKQVSDVANAGWNVSVDGEGAVADNNVGPAGVVDFSNEDGNISISRDGTDLAFELADEITVDTITAGDTFIDTTGVAIGSDVHLGNTGLVINGGPSVTLAGIDAGGMVITNVAPGEISAASTDAINGSQLHDMGDSIVTVIGGNAELNPDGTVVTSDIGGTGHDNIDDAIRSANEAANAGWTATDADGNAANIGPNGSVNFTGDGNISVAQTGDDNSGEIEITLNRDLDVDSITAGDTVIDTDGVRVGDDVHLGDTGLVIEGGPSVTTEGIDAGGSTITNVAAGVNDTDAANVGQLNQVAGDVNDLGDRMDVVEGDVSDLQAGAAGPFQVSQEAPLVPPTPTGENSAAGGSGADASGDNSTALGNQAVASGDNSTAVGQGAQATHDNSVALGQGSATTVGAQSGYDAAYVGSSNSSGEVNVGNRTISGVAPGVAGNDAVNVNQLNAGVNHAVVTANDYTDQRINQVQGDVWHLHGRVDDLEKSINSGVATAMAMRQAPYVAGATTYFAGFGAYKDQGALGVSLRRTADNGRWSLEGGFSANRDGAGGYVGVSGVLGSK